MNPVGWFEIPVNDIARATLFYEAALNIKMTPHEMGPMKMSWFPMDEKAPGATGSLVQDKAYIPSQQGALVYFSCENIDETLGRITQKGGKILQLKTSIGKYGNIASFEDTEGNRVSLHSMK